MPKDTLGALEKRVIDAINAAGSRIDSLAKHGSTKILSLMKIGFIRFLFFSGRRG